MTTLIQGVSINTCIINLNPDHFSGRLASCTSVKSSQNIKVPKKKPPQKKVAWSAAWVLKSPKMKQSVMSQVLFSVGIQLNVLRSSEAPKGTIGWAAFISWGLRNHTFKKTKAKLHILWESATKRQVDRFYLKAAAFPRKYGRSRGHVTSRSANRRPPWRSLPVVFPVSVCKLRKKNWKCDKIH